jgi:hypothetical protein
MMRGLLLGLLAVTACGESSGVTGTASVASVTASAGNLQTATVGTLLSDSLAVLVADANGAGLANVTVTWTPNAVGGTPSGTQVVTNANGIAKIAWTLGTIPGTDSMTAAVNGIHTIFIATATVGAPAHITVISGNGLNSAPGSTLPPLSAKVGDVYGNPVPNVTVTWAVTAGGGSLTNTTTTTDVNGLATNTWTLGSVGGGAVNTVSATVANVSGTVTPATFTATAGLSPYFDIGTMQTGDVRVFRYDQVPNGLTIPASLASAQYLIIASNDNIGSNVIPQLTVDGSWNAPTGGSQAAANLVPPTSSTLRYTSWGGARAAAFEAQLRELERSQLPRTHPSAPRGLHASFDRQIPAPVKATLPRGEQHHADQDAHAGWLHWHHGDLHVLHDDHGDRARRLGPRHRGLG